jgi:crotonobetainyl-CoA:carnitine CoA-transferase CaiB-like acyl-CoA transferase
MRLPRMHLEDRIALDSHRYAEQLLRALGESATPLPRDPGTHPARRWLECGGMALTGRRDGPPVMCPVPLASSADGTLLALRAIADLTGSALPPGAELLSERARHAGLTRNGPIAPGGACRLLDCADGRIAVTLAREHDWAALPAWLESNRLPAGFPGEPAWAFVAAAVADRPAGALVERGRLLALAVATDRLEADPMPGWFVIDCENGAARPRSRARPLVVDLSALWAGPLCTHLFQLLGARVIKVESTSRPDGMRAGANAFYDLLNYGKASVALDFRSQRDLDVLRRLVAGADIVVEASRPRALRQIGLDAAQYCSSGFALTWLSLTAHGREPPQDGWIGFGDDTAVDAGLATIMRRATGESLFCGDAIADPLAGMHAALAGWWSHRRGGSRRIALSLRGVVRNCMDFGAPLDRAALRERQARWTAEVHATDSHRGCNAARLPAGNARRLGADNAAIFAEYVSRPTVIAAGSG